MGIMTLALRLTRIASFRPATSLCTSSLRCGSLASAGLVNNDRPSSTDMCVTTVDDKHEFRQSFLSFIKEYEPLPTKDTA